jgi:hypothetical protein
MIKHHNSNTKFNPKLLQTTINRLIGRSINNDSEYMTMSMTKTRWQLQVQEQVQRKEIENTINLK